MTKRIHGTVRGNTIELDDAPGIADGQRVEVVLTVEPPGRRWGEGILRSAGVAANSPEFDRVFEQIEKDRGRALR